MTGVVAGGQGADQPATLGFRQRRVGGLADQRVAEQRHVSAAVLHRASWRLEQQNSGHWPLKQPPPRGNPCWERSRPPLAEDANDHGAIVPSRNAAARAATATASTASPDGVPVGATGATGANIGSRLWARTVNHTRIASALAAKRRNQPRTVEGGTPTNTTAAR